MAEESQEAAGTPTVSDDKKKETKTTTKKQKGILSRMWNGIFRSRNEDFEKRLQHLSKAEASILAKMKRRSQSGRRIARNIIVLSIILEIIAVGYAVMTTRSFDLDWKMRAIRVLPMFVLPGLSSVIYSALASFVRMRERKDQKTLESLRAERQAKIDELKERTNYYITQQLIQRYDPDPAAKAAAATVLASKLGADSGFKVHLGDDTKLEPPSGRSKDVEFAQSKGLRNRKQSLASSNNAGNLQLQQSVGEVPNNMGSYGSESTNQNQVLVVDHHPNSTVPDGGWIARIAALLVGEDPSQSYALICGNCHMHNGLAKKEEFPFITYYCPHCHALNRAQNLDGNASVSSSSNMSLPPTPNSADALTTGADIGSSAIITASNNSPGAVVETTDASDEKVSKEKPAH